MFKYCVIVACIIFGISIEEAPAQEYGGYKQGEIYCLVENIYHEARGEGSKGWLAVMEVTLNRVDSKKWPNTICGVVYQKNQFSWTSDESKKFIPNQSVIFQKIKNQVLDWIKNGYQPVTEDANHYATVDTHRNWMKKMTHVATIGGHKFFKG